MDWKRVFKLIGRLLLAAMVGIAALYVGAFGLLLATAVVPSPDILSCLGVIYAILIGYLCLRICSKTIAKKIVKVFLGVQAIAVAVLLVLVAHSVYDASLPTVSDGLALADYQPYSGTLVARMDAPADLQLSEELPRLDCATALYPVAAAFVQAVYPEGEYARYGRADEVPLLACSGTSNAYDKLMEGTVDIIFVAGPSEEQLARAAQAGVELIMTPIGKEAFVFFVNSRNPVTTLRTEEIQGIYAGRISNWREVGGNADSIRAFQRRENSGSQTALQQFMQGETLMDPPTEDIVDVMSGIIEWVSDYKNYKNAIGFSFCFYATEMVQNDEIRLLHINGIAPNKETIRDGTYPITSEFYVITTDRTSNPNVEAFLDWIQSAQGQSLIEEVGYVGLR